MQINEPFVLVASIMIGLALGAQGFTFGGSAEIIITLGLILMLYGAMLEVPLGRVLEAPGSAGFILLSLVVNFLFVPLFAWSLSAMFTPHPSLLLGLVIYFVMPCTDWFLTFTSLAKGDVALGTVLIPVNLALQLALLPLYIYLFLGSTVALNIEMFFKAVVLFFLIPLLLAGVSRRWFEGYAVRRASKTQPFFLGIVIAVMFASQEELFLEELESILWLLVPVAIFFSSMFVVNSFLKRVLDLERARAVLLNFTTSARNSPFALAIVLGAFPGMPLAAAVIAVAPLVEIPALAIEARILKYSNDGWEV